MCLGDAAAQLRAHLRWSCRASWRRVVPDASFDGCLFTDGPFVEAKEHLGGFYIVAAQDLDAALGWAAKVTAAVGMPIEVRPLWEAPGA